MTIERIVPTAGVKINFISIVEFKKIEEYLPSGINIIDKEKLSIEVQKLIEGFGYISRDKYEFLKKIIDARTIFAVLFF